MIQEAEAGGSQFEASLAYRAVPGQPGLHRDPVSEETTELLRQGRGDGQRVSGLAATPDSLGRMGETAPEGALTSTGVHVYTHTTKAAPIATVFSPLQLGYILIVQF